MPLPKSVHPEAETVKLSGGEVTVRALTLKEVRLIRNKPEDQADVHAIAWATGESVEDTGEWFETALAGDLQRLIGVIFRLSGLSEDARFQG